MALRGRRMDRSLLLWAGARGGGGAAPRHSPLRPARRDLRGRFPPPHAPAGGFRMGALQSTAGATPPRAPKRSSPGAPMAHRGRGQLPPPSPAPWQGLRSLPPCREWHPGVPAARGPPPVPGPAGEFLETPTRSPLPTVDHRARLHDRMGGPYSGRGVGARMGPVVRRHARPGGSRTTVRRHPAQGVAAAHLAAAHHDPRGGPRPPVGRGGKGMATGGPGATSGVEWGRVLAHPSAHPLPHCPPHRQRAPSHGDTHMGTRRGHHPVAPPGGQSRPARRGALQNWGACVRRRPVLAGRHSGALTPHAPHRPCSRAAPGARQLRQAAGRVGGSRGRQPTGPPPPGRRGRVPVGHAGAPPHRAPHVYGNPPSGASPPRVG